MGAIWKNGVEPIALLNHLLEHRNQGKSGNVTYTGINLDWELFLISSAISIQGEISSTEKNRWIQKALFAPMPIGKTFSATILRTVEAEKAEDARRPLTPYIVVSSCSIDPQIRLPTIRLLPDVEVSFPSGVHRRVQDIRATLQKAHSMPTLPELDASYRYVIVRCRAPSAQIAVERAAEHADVLRTIWNLFLNRGTWRWSSSSTIEPVNRIRLGYLHTVHLKDGEAGSESWWYQPEYQRPGKVVDLAPHLTNLTKFSRLVQRRLGRLPYASLVRRALSQYGSALDRSEMNESFHRLWSVLEHLTGSRDGVVVKRRACAVWSNSGIAELALESLRERRNELIHEGKDTQQGELCVYSTKQFVEALFEFHLAHGSHLGSVEAVWDFFDLHRYLRKDARIAAILSHARRYYLPRIRHRKATASLG